jgi:hypothetical protein
LYQKIPKFCTLHSALCTLLEISARARGDAKLSDEFRIICLLFIEIFPAVEFGFLSDVVVTYWPEIAHHSRVDLARHPLDLFSFFVVECHDEIR